MTAAKNVYALMLALVIVLSGCFGNTADDTDAQEASDTADTTSTTIVNNFYNNTTTVIHEMPEMIAVGGIYEGIDGENDILFTISTTSGQMVEIHQAMAMESEGEYEGIRMFAKTTCLDFVEFNTADDISHISSGHAQNKPIYLPGAFDNCTHEIWTFGGDNTGTVDLSWSLVYSIVPVTVG